MTKTKKDYIKHLTMVETVRENLYKKMLAAGLNMKKLSIKAGLNETGVRDILRGRVKSPSFDTLYCLAKALNTSIDELTEDLTEEGKRARKLAIFNKVAMINAITKVDEIIERNKLNFTAAEKAQIYIAWYELLIINQELPPSINLDSQLTSLLKVFSSKI